VGVNVGQANDWEVAHGSLREPASRLRHAPGMSLIAASPPFFVGKPTFDFGPIRANVLHRNRRRA